MTISTRVQRELLEGTPATTAAQKRRRRATASAHARRTRAIKAKAVTAPKNKGKAWTVAEHQRFLQALELYPTGPWRTIAAYVGTKNPRQTMTHAQKFRQKMERRKRGLRNCRRKRGRCASSSASTSTSTAKPTRTRTRPPRRAAAKRRIVVESESESESENESENEVETDSTSDSDSESSMEEEELAPEQAQAQTQTDVPIPTDCEMDVDTTAAQDPVNTSTDALDSDGSTSPFSDAVPDSVLFPLVDLWTSSAAAVDDALADMNGFYLGLECC